LSTPPVPRDIEPDQETRLSWNGYDGSPEAPTVPRGRNVTQSFELSGAKAPSEPTIQPVEQPPLPEGRPGFAKTLAPSPLMLQPEPDKPDKGSGD
jgi:hypothetical protein